MDKISKVADMSRTAMNSTSNFDKASKLVDILKYISDYKKEINNKSLINGSYEEVEKNLLSVMKNIKNDLNR